MAPSAGWKQPGLGVAALAILGSLFRGRAAEEVSAQAAIAAAAGSPTPIVWRHIDALNALRAEGFTCPEGSHVPPNPVLLKFDCNLWRAGQSRLQELDSSNASHVAPAGVVQSSSAEAGVAEDVLASFRRSGRHCRDMMDPHARLVGVAHSAAGGRRQDKHYWVQLFSTEEAPQDTSCFEELRLAPTPSAAPLVPSPAPLRAPAVDLPTEAEERRLKAGAGSAGGDSGGSIVGSATPSPSEAYQGPGQTFGMVLLIISVGIFCFGTFGSILIGNCILERRARAEVSALTMPTP